VHGYIIIIGTLIGMLPTVLDSLLSQTRILYRVSKDKIINPKFMEVNPRTQVPSFAVISTGVVIMIIVLLFDIEFLAQFISISTLAGYCLIMSIVVTKKMLRKTLSATLQGLLFVFSLLFGFTHSLQADAVLVSGFLAGCVILVIVIFVESKYYPDVKQIEDDLKENETFIDKPYTCMLNPVLPCIGIWGSGTVIGYIDIIVWASFFVIVLLIAGSYFAFVLPRKYREKSRGRFPKGSIYTPAGANRDSSHKARQQHHQQQ
jgi:amino acid transporter